MARIFVSILLICFSLTAVFAGEAPEIYTPSGKKRLASSKSLNDRVKVYDSAFERIRKEIEKDIRDDRFDDAALTLKKWSALLNESQDDIEANINPKKKPGKLRQYEIHLRQAIRGLRNLRMRSPIELYDALISFEDQAEETRHKFMNILF